MNENKNGRATLRDVMEMQNRMFEQNQKILGRVSKLETKVALIAGSVSTVISLVVSIAIKLFS